jgi:hypothetical protein
MMRNGELVIRLIFGIRVLFFFCMGTSKAKFMGVSWLTDYL